MSKCYGGEILRVDLTSGKVKKDPTKKRLMANYLGGEGFGVRLLYQGVDPRVDAFSSKNALIITPGLFTGLPIPTAGKTTLHAKSPLNNGFGESVVGATLGAELKYAGYDALVLKGTSAKPSYLVIDNGNVEIKSCDFWGTNIRECVRVVKEEVGEHFRIACIGIGGENLVRYACVDCEGRQAGRVGMGAVMGSKKLKAIAVHGTGDLCVESPQELSKLARQWFKEIVESSSYQDDTKYGTGEFLEWVNDERGTFPTNNWQASVFKYAKQISPYFWVPKYVKKNKACVACIKPCGKLFKIEKGKYKGTVIEGVEYETLYALGSNCGTRDIEIIAKANELCDLYGLDTISTGCVIAYTKEASARKIITGINFEEPEAILILIEKIAKRSGIGDLLAEGVKRLAQRIGGKEFALHVKGVEPPGYDVRGIKGLGLAFLTSPRGACHLRSCAYAPELTGKFWKFKDVDRFSAKNKGEEVKEMEDLMTIYDCFGVCKFSRGIYLLEGFSELLQATIGRKLTEAELLKIGERINNLKRLFNLNAGIGIEEFKLPARVQEPIREGVSKGSFISPAEEKGMLEDYLRARGWDANAVPTDKKLEDLGLK